VSSVDLNLKAARGYQLYKVAGWTLREYQAACTNTAFYNSVKQNLHPDGFAVEDLEDPLQRNDAVAAKFHLAGANARRIYSTTSLSTLRTRICAPYEPGCRKTDVTRT
jgi:hypothetical protein